MEQRAGGLPPTNQWPIQGSSPLNDAHSRTIEVKELGKVSPVNYSIQTGEEFALEFMRERAHPKKLSPQIASGSKKGILSPDSDFGSNPSLHAVVEKGWSTESTEKVLRSESKRNVQGHVSTAASEMILSRKFLLSFGGKILPRPSDGKLRYVGGETRMVRIANDVSWKDFVVKISSIYNQVHAIKYQLPGEDLDALVSVSCDEDLQNMMEEYSVLPSSEGSQKLRIFLFSSLDCDDMQFGLNSMDGDSEVQYVVAVNGMDVSHGRSSTDKTDVMNLNNDHDDKTEKMSNLELPVPEVSHFVSTPLAVSGHAEVNNMNNNFHMPPSLSADNEKYGKVSISLPNDGLPRDSLQAKQNAQLEDSNTKVISKETGEVASRLDTTTYPHHHEGISSQNRILAEDSSHSMIQDLRASPLGSKVKDQSEPEVSVWKMPPLDFREESQAAELNYGDRDVSGAQAHVSSPIETEANAVTPDDGPIYFRNFRSEMIPRGQFDSVHRLSKSDDSISTQFRTPDFQSTSNPVYETQTVSQSDASTPKHPGLDSVSVGDGLTQFEKRLDVVDPILCPNPAPEKEVSKTMSPHLTNQNWRSPEKEAGISEVATTLGPRDAIRNAQSYIIGDKFPNSDSTSVISTLEGKKIHEDDMIFLDGEARKPLDCVMTEDAPGNLRPQPPEIGYFHRKQDDPASSLSELHWGEIPKESMHVENVEGQPTVSQFDWAEKSAVSSFPPDICIDIEDRFPRDLLSDIFSKARMAPDSSSMGHTLGQDDIALSLDMHNPEPEHWSFFRNLAQDEFNQPRKDISLIDQDQIPFTSVQPNDRNIGPVSYEFPLNFDAAINVAGNDNVTGSRAHAHEKGDVIKAEKPLVLPSEYEGMKVEFTNACGPVSDIFLKDADRTRFQQIKNEDLEEMRELGSGTFGTVYHGKWRGTDVAIKRIKKSCFTGRSSEQERLTEDFWREAEILSKLHHPNVVAFYGVVENGPGATLATVTEYMVNGSLRHVLLRNNRYLDHRKRLIIAMDAAIGMEYLHSKSIVHFDLKCDNLLVNLKDPQRPICKVGDFGLSKIKRNTLVSGGVRGTLPWMAPELLNGSSNKVSEKVDVFSFGIVMWEILTGEEPYANMHYGAIIGGIVSNTLRPPVPASCDPEWRRLMEQCWAPDPAQRPSFTEIAGRLRSMSLAFHHKSNPKATPS
ncbi:RAF-like serine/threonine-protein kinase 24 [Wolffia australiana]